MLIIENKKKGLTLWYKKSLPLVVLLSLTFCFYLPLLKGFFQQDEWYSFTWFVLHRNLIFVESIKFFFAPSVGHYNPFTNLLQFYLLSHWGMNYLNFSLLGIVLHLIVTATVYFLAKLVFKNGNLAFLCALLFGVFASPYQGTAWVIADMSTLISSFLGLTSTYLFVKFMRGNKTRYLVWSLVLLIISLFFKEVTIGLFALYLGCYLLERKRASKSKNLLLIFTFGTVYFLFRVVMIFAPNTTGDQLVTQSQSLFNIIYNFLTVPIKSISQIIFPPDFMKSVAFAITRLFPKWMTGGIGSPMFESFAIHKVMEILNILIGIGIIGLGFFVIKKTKIKYKKIIIFGLGWGIINSFIFSLAPENPGKIFVVDSRNLYFTSVGIAFFLIAIIDFVLSKKQVKGVLLFLILFIFNAILLRNNLNKYVEAGEVRRNILQQISKTYDDLPPKTIFYITSDSSYYGLPENEKILPFQSGLGQTLLVWYYPTENFPTGFFENKYLWDITTQGYKEIDNRGFGYFRDFDALQKTIKSYNISTNSIYAFSWNSKKGILTNDTRQIRASLSKTK